MARNDTQNREHRSLLSRWLAVVRSFTGAMGAVGRLVTSPERPLVEIEHHKVRFEHSDLKSRNVIITGFSILGAMWICAFILFFYYRYAQHTLPQSNVSALPVAPPVNALPPEPRLQTAPRTDMAQELAYEKSELHHYSWVDRNKRTITIPIERAMQIVAERGIAPQTTPADLKLYPPSAGTRDTGFEGKIQPAPK